MNYKKLKKSPVKTLYLIGDFSVKMLFFYNFIQILKHIFGKLYCDLGFMFSKLMNCLLDCLHEYCAQVIIFRQQNK